MRVNVDPPLGRPILRCARAHHLKSGLGFSRSFGLRSLDQLPTLAELRDVETIGVQLELPGGEMPAEALEIEEVASEVAVDDADVPVDAAPSDEADDAASPSLVASADDDEPHTLIDPPL